MQDPKNRQKLAIWAHHTTLPVCIFATKAHIDNWKKNFLNSNISPTCTHNVLNFGPLAAEIGSGVCAPLQVSQLEFNVPFQHKYGYIRDKRSGMESYPYPAKEGQRYINLNPGRLFVQQPPKKGRDQEAHLNYYASAYIRGDNYCITRLKLNQHELNKHASLTNNTANINTKQSKPRFGRLLRPLAWKRSGSIFWKVRTEGKTHKKAKNK